MRYHLALVLAFCWTELFAQSVTKSIGGKFGNQIGYGTCKVAFIVDDGSFGIRFPYQNGLTKYFSDQLQSGKIKGLTGKLFLQIIIMHDGKPCCKSISKVSGNFTLNELDELALDSLVNKMPHWTISKPTKLGKEKANYSIALDLIFNGESGLFVKYNPLKYIIGKNK